MGLPLLRFITTKKLLTSQTVSHTKTAAHTTRIALLHLSFLLAITSLSACSTVYDNTVGLFMGGEESAESVETSRDTSATKTKPSPQIVDSAETTKVAIENLAQTPAVDEVEILWEIPRETVDGFILQYGFSETMLDNEKRLQLSDIEKFDDPNFGFVYRYLLKGIPRETTLYVRLATTKGDQKSEFSETFTVKPE